MCLVRKIVAFSGIIIAIILPTWEEFLFTSIIIWEEVSFVSNILMPQQCLESRAVCYIWELASLL